MPLIPASTPTAVDASPIELHLRQLRDWNVTPEIAEQIGLRVVTNAEARLLLGRRNSQFWAETRSATYIPVRDRFGTEVGFRLRFHGEPPPCPPVPPPGMDHRDYEKRWRKSHGKYMGPKGTATPVHHPLGIAQTGPVTRVCLVEGEMKAEAGTRAGVATLGLAGWHGALIDGKILKSPIDHYVTDPAVTEIIFVVDSDGNLHETPKDREKHKQAMHAVVSLGAAVDTLALRHNKLVAFKYVFVPSMSPTGKTGLDDYLAAGGNYEELLSGAQTLSEEVASPEYFAAVREFGPYIVSAEMFWWRKESRYLTVRGTEVALGKHEPVVIDSLTGKRRKFYFREDYLKSPFVYAFNKVDWIPDGPEALDDDVYNTFLPDYPPAEVDPTAKGLIERHLELFFDRNLDQIPQFWAWVAHVHQYPAEIHDILLHLYGSGGSGKSLWAYLIQASMSVTGRNVRMWNNIGGRFDDSLARSHVSFADETSYEMRSLADLQSHLREVLTAPQVRVEMKGVQGYTYYRNCAAKIVCQNPGEMPIGGANNRRIWSPDIPVDTDNMPNHPCCTSARALGEYFRENRKAVAGTVRAIALEQDRVLERYQALREMLNVTETRQELRETSSTAVSRALEFIDNVPEDIEVIMNEAIRMLPPYAGLPDHQVRSDFRTMSSVIRPYNGGAAVKVHGKTVRMRIIRNLQKWGNKNNHTREELNEQIERAERWLASKKF